MWRHKVFHSVPNFPCLMTSENEQTEKIILFFDSKNPFKTLVLVKSKFVFGVQIFFLIRKFWYKNNLIFLFLRLLGKSLFREFNSVTHTGEFIICDNVYINIKYWNMFHYLYSCFKECFTILSLEESIICLWLNILRRFLLFFFFYSFVSYFPQPWKTTQIKYFSANEQHSITEIIFVNLST